MKHEHSLTQKIALSLKTFTMQPTYVLSLQGYASALLTVSFYWFSIAFILCIQVTDCATDSEIAQNGSRK